LRRVSKVGTRISTSQIVGYVGISGDTNADIEDTSDRERFVQNDAAKEFRVLLYHVIEALEMERDKDRETPPPNPTDMFSGISAADIVSEARRAKEQGADADEIIALVEGFDRKLEGTRKTVEQHFTYYSRLATLGTMAAMLVHEIGNKRLYIQSFVDAVRTYLAEPNKGIADVKKTLKYAEEALSHLQRLAEVFYPLAARGYKRGRRTASIAATLEMCRIAQEKPFEERGITWATDLKGADEVKLDPAELHAVLQNLIDNSVYWIARKESGDKKLLIETRRTSISDRVQVMVHDSGVGVANEDRPKIFNPGYTRRPNGAGMGLTVAGEIVSQHDGKLRLAPKGRLGGATFDFTLPIAK
jgi:signal transduction histidine kinase